MSWLDLNRLSSPLLSPTNRLRSIKTYSKHLVSLRSILPMEVGGHKESSDLLNLFLYVLENITSIVICSTTFMILCLRSIHSIYFTLGIYLCGLGTKLLQNLIKESRPKESMRLSYGMPSAHSAAITYIAVYTLLTSSSSSFSSSTEFISSSSSTLRLLHQFKEVHLHHLHHGIFEESNRIQFLNWIKIINLSLKWIINFSLIGLAGSVCWSRHRFQHHTTKQILVGIVFGCLFSIGWFSIWSFKMLPLFDHHHPFEPIHHVDRLFF